MDVRDEPGGCCDGFDAGPPSSGSSPSTPGESVSFTASDCTLSVSTAEESLEAIWRKEGRLDSAAPAEPRLCLLTLFVELDTDGRGVREAAEGAGGGPMEVFVVVLDGRDRVVGGREVSSMEGLRDSCFVGDFIGD